MTLEETVQRFRDWCVMTRLPIKRVAENIFEIQVDEDRSEKFLLVTHKDGIIFDQSMKILLSEDEKNHSVDIDNFTFLFGNRFYFFSKDSDRVHFFPLIHLGKARRGKLDTNVPFLGIHSKYEILNGSKGFSEWVKRAKFLGIDTLGVCEKNSISSALTFQLECAKNGIKSVIGATESVSDHDKMYSIKLYVINSDGWRNLLSINAEINIHNNGSIEKDKLMTMTDGLVCVIDPVSVSFDDPFVQDMKKSFENIYYQFDTRIYIDESQNDMFLSALQQYMLSDMNPVIINDAYYLTKMDRRAKSIMNAVANRKTEFETDDASFKDINSNLEIATNTLFSTYNEAESFLGLCIENTKKVGEMCSFSVNTGRKYLPDYIMTEKEASIYKTNLDLFYGLIIEGLNKLKNYPNYNTYLEKARYEAKILVKYGFVDYFLIVRDFLVNYCRENGILTGIGRGSVGGSIIAYLLNISYTDPVRYDLLFSRFLNEGRLEKNVKAKKYTIQTETGDVELWDTDLVMVSRDGREVVIMVQDLNEGEEFEIVKRD